MDELILNINPQKQKMFKITCTLFSYILSMLIAWFVFYHGGTKTIFSNLMFIPISILSSVLGKKYGVIHAIFSGLLLGPHMPLSSEDLIMQQPLNWHLRIFIYVFVATMVGYFSDKYKQNMKVIIDKESEIVESRLATIYSLVKLAEMRDDDTGAHIVRVSKFCKLIALQLRSSKKYRELLTDTYIDDLAKAAPLHDIGKVGIPDSILSKPGKLTDEEYEIMKKHTTIGASTLGEVRKRFPDNNFITVGSRIALYHHEKWDGTGYPHGLVEDEIPLSARIMAVADVYDALRSRRVYKAPFSHQESIEIIAKDSGKHFDPEIVEVFLECAAEIEFIYKYTTYSDFDY
ncbi:HD-GYP domain-containing protein [Acidaminobacter hydrogenoformans]|uniref:HD-GYP domain-containing protein n=1 Tax=Acidaminobacter hydrogenoformans DSM 2784 TaxID=1120920 RepID=A0A1G5S2S6_9FIRM|nr:HD domain-containing phosphohydrolase [Acidaminobacter hydrogenoformans]SCZ80437.1 protein of unknown function [Acidaminobacter hydrogenoformans DSM 2784]